MKNVVILNGSTRRAGRLDQLTQAFIKGAQQAGHQVTEIFTVDLAFSGTLWSNDQEVPNPYRTADILALPGRMGEFYRAVNAADVVALASPIYWWTVSGSLKQAIDYLQPLQQALGYQSFIKESVLLGVAGGHDYQNLIDWYHYFEHYLHWPNRGEVLGSNQVQAAQNLGTAL